MQLTPRREQTIEKIIRDADGRLVRATFCVYEHDGRIKARLLHVVLIEEFIINNKVFALETFQSKKPNQLEKIFQTKIISPYFNVSLLHVLGSKPRAPTF